MQWIAMYFSFFFSLMLNQKHIKTLSGLKLFSGRPEFLLMRCVQTLKTTVFYISGW